MTIAGPRIWQFQEWKKILENSNYPHRVKALVYEKGSHFIGCADVPEKLRKLKNIMFSNEKRFPNECNKTRKDSQKQILDFLNEW